MLKIDDFEHNTCSYVHMNGICDDFANTEGNSTNLKSLVTQPMMQRQPNCTELRLMDSYIQILCRFQKSKQKRGKG